MIRGLLLSCTSLLLAWSVPAQDSLGGTDYEWLTLHPGARFLDGNIDIGPRRIEAAVGEIVHLTFEKASPADNLVVKAKTVELEYEEGELTRVILTGNVFVQHPDATVTADAGVLDIAEGTAEFTGNCTLASEKSGNATGTKVTFEFESGDFLIEKPTFRYSFGPRSKSGDLTPLLLAQDDVTDWTGFLTKLQAQAKSGTPSPGGRLVALLPKNYADLVRDSLIENLMRGRETILDLLNDILQNPELYEGEAWEGIELGPAVTAMLPGDSVTDPKAIVWLNRSLLRAAYPEYMTPPPALETPKDEN